MRSATIGNSLGLPRTSWKSLRGAAQRAQPTGGRSPSVEPLDSCLCQGIPNTYDNTSSLQQRLHQSTVQMPVGYVVSPNGRIGAELRVARDTHELVATGTSARLGILLPYHTTTTNTGPNGRPIEVRLSFALVTWLVLGTLTITDEVAEFFVYMYVVGAERLGAACDMVLTGYDNTSDLTLQGGAAGPPRVAHG